MRGKREKGDAMIAMDHSYASAKHWEGAHLTCKHGLPMQFSVVQEALREACCNLEKLEIEDDDYPLDFGGQHNQLCFDTQELFPFLIRHP